MVDLDGVVWDIMGVFINIYNKIYKEKIRYNDVNDWYYFPQSKWEIIYPLTLLEIKKYPIIDENISFYLFYLNKYYDVNILTKKQNSVCVLTEKLKSIGVVKKWMYNDFIKIDVEDKKLNYEADIYIDDNPNMIEEMIDYPERTLLLFTQPWNKKYDVSEIKNIIRVSGWDDTMEKIKIIKKLKLMS